MEYINIFLLITILILLSIVPELYKKYKINKKIFKSNNKNISGYVYIISNPIFKEDIVKIGMTRKKDYNKRIKELYNTSIPEPFKIEYIISHEYPEELEKFLHKKFKKYRINKRREFFHIKKDILKKELINLT